MQGNHFDYNASPVKVTISFFVASFYYRFPLQNHFA